MKAVLGPLSTVVLSIGAGGSVVTYGSFVWWHIFQGEVWLLNPLNIASKFVMLPGFVVAPFIQWWLEDSIPQFTFIFWVIAWIGAILMSIAGDD